MSELADDRRLIIECGHDEINATRHDDGSVWIEIVQPFAGDTERGLGVDANVTLSAEQAKFLAAFLLCDISDSRAPAPTPSPSNATRQCDSSES